MSSAQRIVCQQYLLSRGLVLSLQYVLLDLAPVPFDSLDLHQFGHWTKHFLEGRAVELERLEAAGPHYDTCTPQRAVHERLRVAMDGVWQCSK